MHPEKVSQKPNSMRSSIWTTKQPQKTRLSKKTKLTTMGCNTAGLNKAAEALVFAKRKPTFKIRIDSLRAKGAQTDTSTSPKKKSVRIAENRNTVLFRHVLDSELKQTWYESKDYDKFQKDSKGTLNALKQAQGNLAHLDADKHCIRGLEAHVSSSILQLRKMRIYSTVKVVLDQQRVQRHQGISDPNMLSAVSMMFSSRSRQHALSMGSLDNSLCR
jgi:hypothetical protein